MGLLGQIFKGNNNVDEMLQNGAVVIDVRTPEEYKQGHVQGSKNIPLDKIPGSVQKIKGMNKQIVLCCASGMRSGRATDMLKNHGIDCCNGGSWTSVSRKV